MKNLSVSTYLLRSASVLVFLVLTANFVRAQERLVVVGGGTRPPEAMKKFIEWSGGEKAHILIVTWASGEPAESFEGLKKNFATLPASAVVHAPVAPLDAAEREQFVAQVAAATGIFFSGGDQNRIMDVLADEGLLKLLKEKYASGVAFGGTSAGAALMSDPMMTGEADLKILDGTKVGVRKGLGLLPNAIFDQHFLVRQRHNRLLGLVMQNPAMLGIGIDEDTAVLIEDNRRLEVAGATQVMFVDAKNRNGAMLIHLLKPGERFDLRKRKPSGRRISKPISVPATGQK